MSKDKDGNTPLSIAFTKDIKVVKEILGKDKNITDTDGNTPVHIAVNSKAKSDILKYLLNNDYPFDTRNSSGFTPLALCVKNNDKNNANILLEKGASIYSDINNKKENILTFVLKEKNSELIGFILKYCLDKVDIKGNTILHYAAIYGDEQTVSRILSTSINKNAKNLLGETAYDLAVNWERTKIAELLK